MEEQEEEMEGKKMKKDKNVILVKKEINWFDDMFILPIDKFLKSDQRLRNDSE